MILPCFVSTERRGGLSNFDERGKLMPATHCMVVFLPNPYESATVLTRRIKIKACGSSQGPWHKALSKLSTESAIAPHATLLLPVSPVVVRRDGQEADKFTVTVSRRTATLGNS